MLHQCKRLRCSLRRCNQHPWVECRRRVISKRRKWLLNRFHNRPPRRLLRGVTSRRRNNSPTRVVISSRRACRKPRRNQAIISTTLTTIFRSESLALAIPSGQRHAGLFYGEQLILTNNKLRYLLIKITAEYADKTVTAPAITHPPFSSGSDHTSSIQHPFSPDRLNCPALVYSDCRFQ